MIIPTEESLWELTLETEIYKVVDDVKKIINSKIDLPPGYRVTYGGQFENLESAKARLMIAVPLLCS